MMGIEVPETCWGYKKYNKIISSIYLVLILQLSQWCTVQHTSNSEVPMLFFCEPREYCWVWFLSLSSYVGIHSNLWTRQLKRIWVNSDQFSSLNLSSYYIYLNIQRYRSCDLSTGYTNCMSLCVILIVNSDYFPKDTCFLSRSLRVIFFKNELKFWTIRKIKSILHLFNHN